MLAACYLALTTELLHEELHHHQEPFTSILGFMLMLAKNPFRTIHKHPFALSVQKIIRNKQKMWKLWISVLSYSMKSFTTPWEPVTLFSGFILMLAKNPFGTIHKHPFALSVQKIIRNRQKMWKLWMTVLSSA